MICRLYLDQALQIGASVTLPADQAHYLRQVMRLQSGDAVVIFNGRGGEYRGHIEQLSKAHSSCLLESFADINRELAFQAHIIQAACRNEKIEAVLQKGTELGAASFQIVRSQRASLKLAGDKLDRRLLRWRKIIIEATEQSGRTRIPDLFWRDSLTSLSGEGLCIALHPDAATGWSETKRSLAIAPDISLAIGPEGGWSAGDLKALRMRGFHGLAFGSRILRTETAAPSLLAAIQAIRND